MISEHDRVVLTLDLQNQGLRAGDIGTVIHVYDQGKAFEVEFSTLAGKTLAVETLSNNQVRSVTDLDIPHVRKVEDAA